MKLNAWNMSDGSVQIHQAGCNHRPSSRTRRTGVMQQDQVEFGKHDWPSKYAFAYDYWNNGILEEHEAENGKGSFDVFQEMDFAPCTRALPTEENEVTEKAQKPGKTPKDTPLGKAPGTVPAPTAHLKASEKSLNGKCRCGCGETVGKGSTFRQGHDARWVSALVSKVGKGEVKEAEALKEAKSVSDALHGKLAKALDNAKQAKAKSEAAAAAKAEKAKAEKAKAAKEPEQK